MPKSFADWFAGQKPAGRSVDDCYDADGTPRCCWKCGSTSFREVVRAAIDVGVGAGMPAEVETFCEACGQSVAYWAYGGFDPAWIRGEFEQQN